MTADQVVASLAGCKEPVEPENGTCILCGRSLSCSGRIDDHERSCPWRMAKDYLEGMEPYHKHQLEGSNT
jgi:hypothetical protein